MKLKDFNEQILGNKERYTVEDKYVSIPCTRFNHIIFDKVRGRRWITVRIKNDELVFIEVFTGEEDDGEVKQEDLQEDTMNRME